MFLPIVAAALLLVTPSLSATEPTERSAPRHPVVRITWAEWGVVGDQLQEPQKFLEVTPNDLWYDPIMFLVNQNECASVLDHNGLVYSIAALYAYGQDPPMRPLARLFQGDGAYPRWALDGSDVHSIKIMISDQDVTNKVTLPQEISRGVIELALNEFRKIVRTEHEEVEPQPILQTALSVKDMDLHKAYSVCKRFVDYSLENSALVLRLESEIGPDAERAMQRALFGLEGAADSFDCASLTHVLVKTNFMLACIWAVTREHTNTLCLMKLIAHFLRFYFAEIRYR
ncbi:MAG: hypothetical protein LBJ42_00695 [Holosporales bacterium]|jgi:hypothetical protein|nr:hypothetical protein [Holosporales bacterium]